MNEFEKILEASRDFFSSPEEEREVIDLIRRDPDAILSGMHKPFMKKLASAIIYGRTIGVKEMLDQEARFQTALEKFRSDTFSKIDYVKRMLWDRDKHIQRLERDLSGAHDKLKEIAEQFTSIHQLLKKQSQSISEIEDRVFSDSEDDEPPEKPLSTRWAEAYAAYPDPCNTSIPLELVKEAAGMHSDSCLFDNRIADAQYYLYFMLGQQCVFDRFWHIKVAVLEKAANQGHIEAIKRMELEFPPKSIYDEVRSKKAIYFKYKLVEKGELPEVEFLEYAWVKGQHVNTSYKIQNPRIACASSAYQVEMCFVIKRRLTTLMKTHYADGSFGHAKCIKLLETLKGCLGGIERAIPGIMAEFEAI